MSEDDPLQTAVQEAMIDLDEPSARPTRITQDARGPSDTILELNLEDPIILFVASDSDDAQPVKAKENAFVESDNNEPPKNRGNVGATPLTNMIKGKQAVNNDFYHEPFIFKESKKETLHIADRSDVMVSGAFISGLHPGRLFKDLIAKPPTSLEDLFTQTHNFILPTKPGSINSSLGSTKCDEFNSQQSSPKLMIDIQIYKFF
uniref:Reverse transcriptase domain-containing protein n=1 Tax=Tanacetum cinerariifolium TaxID=118510 RepID=A0A6L2MC03_TANCI|nr:reverse transcriptase domain-containing protein [Tanacetum cinerariifolium]